MDTTSNPSLSDKSLSRLKNFSRDAADVKTMTVSGVINKTGILLVLLTIAAAVGVSQADTALGMPFLVGGAILGLICSVIIIFNPQTASLLAPIYALLEGVCLGVITANYELRYPGLVTNAVIGTLGILGTMLFCYRIGLLRATPRFKKIVIFSMLAISLCYLADIIMSLFGHNIAMIHQGSTIGIVFSVFVVGIAAMNLIIDFDRVEQGVAARLPQSAEWYFGFSLILTIVWLYLEMLRLLSKRK